MSAAIDGEPHALLEAQAAVVVVGAGQAGSAAAIGLRDAGHAGPITLIGAEPQPPYQRPPLSKKFLTGAAGSAQLVLHGENAIRARGIDLRLDATVTRLDRAGGRVVTSTGEQVRYDHAILATGARNRVLPVDDDATRALSLRGWDDADALRAALELARSVLIVGAGMIGLEVAASASAMGKDVVVVEAAPVLLPHHLSRAVADRLLALHEAHGVRIHCDTAVQTLLAENGRVVGARTSRGELRADLVVDAVGVWPETSLAQECGLEVARGVVVDAWLRTSDPRVSAIGDCAIVVDRQAASGVRVESVQNANDQGAYLARHLRGQDPGRYEAIPWFWTDQFDVRVQMVGLARAGQVEVVGAGGDRVSVYCFADDVLVRVESVGMAGEHLAARKVLAAGCSPTLEEVRAEGFSLKQWWSERSATRTTTTKG